MLRDLPYRAVELSRPELLNLQFRPVLLAPLMNSRHLAKFLQSKLLQELLSLIEVGDIQHQRYLRVQLINQRLYGALDDPEDLLDCSPNLRRDSLRHQIRLQRELILPIRHLDQFSLYSQIFTQIEIFF